MVFKGPDHYIQKVNCKVVSYKYQKFKSSYKNKNIRVSPTGFLQSDLAAKLKIDEF